LSASSKSGGSQDASDSSDSSDSSDASDASDAPRRRIEDPEELRRSLDRADPIVLVLRREGELSTASLVLVERARAQGIPILVESEREMRRMSGGGTVRELIALEAPGMSTSVDELMFADGLVLVLVGIRYPGNAGFILRSAEVAGAAGVVLRE